MTISPTKFAHVVLQTNRTAEMRDFYVQLLGARVQAEFGPMCLLTYDDEHHRVALLNAQDYEERPPNTVGMHHMAFTYGSLEVLLGNYRRLKAAGMDPWWCVNHGPTVSLYYRDPDGNNVELQVDVFDDNDDVNAFLATLTTRAQPLGIDFDPDAMLARLESGVPAQQLMAIDG
ncbi:VOC family protein [Pseudonocardia sp. CA-107938]|uniref:VOC family protein n=1 Tax=Pseudonocardia sp. CA-107938 TaxID=3240021 RepID=UPI003D8C0AFC